MNKCNIISSNCKYILLIFPAIGPRPLLDLPDQINFAESSIHIGSEKYLLVKNLGEVPAVFKTTSHIPFIVKPSNGILDAKGTMQFHISFKPTEEGPFEDIFSIKYESGETLVVKLNAIAISANIYLDDDIVQFEDTYMGLKVEKVVKLINNSKHIVHFQWKQYPSYDQDLIQKKLLKNLVNEDKRLCICNYPCDQNLQEENEIEKIIRTRIAEDGDISFEKNELLNFFSPNIQIIPLVN